MTGMLNLKDIFKLIDNGLADGSLAQQDSIGHWGYQLGLHVFGEFGDQMNASEKQPLKQNFRQIAFIAKELTKLKLMSIQEPVARVFR